MAKQKTRREQRTNVHAKRDSKTSITRVYVHSLRGQLKGKGLLKALMTEKEKERDTKRVLRAQRRFIPHHHETRLLLRLHC